MYDTDIMIMGSHIRFDKIEQIKSIPIEFFQLKKLSPLENLVRFLTSKGLKQNEISFLIRRNPRTVWTVLQRVEAKLEVLAKTEEGYSSADSEFRRKLREELNA